MKHIRLFAFVLILGTFVLVVDTRFCIALGKLSLDPSSIRIGTFFGGAHLEVRANISDKSEAVLEVTGEPLAEELMRKGRHWEIWMNVGEITISGLPSVYLAASTHPGLLQGADVEQPWGYASFYSQATFQGDFKKGTEHKVFEEFLRLKERQGLYDLLPGALKTSSAGNGQLTVCGDFELTSHIPPGDYAVCLWEIQNSKVVGRNCAPFRVMLAGTSRFLSLLAAEHPTLYGFLAVGIAIGAGLLTGFLFKRKSIQRSKST